MEVKHEKITGRYKQDNNFITVYCDNTIYTIANNTKCWGSKSVGDRTLTGHIITQEVYNKLASECEKVGTFELI